MYLDSTIMPYDELYSISNENKITVSVKVLKIDKFVIYIYLIGMKIIFSVPFSDFIFKMVVTVYYLFS